MSLKKQYFYIPDNRAFSIITQFIPEDGWNPQPRFVIYLTSCDSTFEIEISSKKGIQMLLKALENLQSRQSDKSDCIQTSVFDQ